MGERRETAGKAEGERTVVCELRTHGRLLRGLWIDVHQHKPGSKYQHRVKQPATSELLLLLLLPGQHTDSHREAYWLPQRSRSNPETPSPVVWTGSAEDLEKACGVDKQTQSTIIPAAAGAARHSEQLVHALSAPHELQLNAMRWVGACRCPVLALAAALSPRKQHKRVHRSSAKGWERPFECVWVHVGKQEWKGCASGSF